jgi:hypothetical protein
MFFVHRNAADFAWGLLLPEYLGSVDAHASSHGWVAANIVSVDQLVKPPSSVTQHEFYHLLGCEHFWMTECYALNRTTQEHGGEASQGRDFLSFPELRYDHAYDDHQPPGAPYLDRNEAGLPPPAPTFGDFQPAGSLANSRR